MTLIVTETILLIVLLKRRRDLNTLVLKKEGEIDNLKTLNSGLIIHLKRTSYHIGKLENNR